MALTVTRLLVPAGSAALRSGNFIQKAGVHRSPVRSLQYGALAYMLGEWTSPRLHKLSKIITVDGNLASGKGALAQKLAESLGMLYMPQVDTFYMDKMNGEKEPLPVDYNGMCSLEKFYLEPKAADGNSYRLQLWMYMMRLLQYADAIEHLLSTGQGVVLHRSAFSDMVFLDAMFKQGYIRKECVEHYNETKHNSLTEFLPPHLVIYIDLPAEDVHMKLKQSGKNIPLQYLKSIEESYKKSFLPSIEETTEVLVYDVVQAQNINMVMDDIEIMEFEKGPWLEQEDINYHELRMIARNKSKLASLTQIPRFLPEITIGAHEYYEKYHAYKSLPGKNFAPGYNEDVGDKHIWLK
ncbi:NADH dehydrogenase [ubiquinone] 1 alpha subcomplex subunit 10, mitochondrial [Nematolebias whitei]|uniref:NADH dehydrogenase [ubiquinone] 1 alpha subcomplex subunit 10, mitochondrial n=1 Tax=Nematolebias whitei TaxID=451745 RepID=UPI00189B82DA|nr:NADH dehydrogenase [ubiquinone] 1 alpha subcomplex subunit 10, mitochondrial [Nematolebias whitei]